MPRIRRCIAMYAVLGSLGVVALLVLGSLGLSTQVMPAQAQQSGGSTVLVSQNPTLGAILTDPQGMTLYIRTSDSAGASGCSGQCAVVWPPFQPPSAYLTLPYGATGTLVTISRDDGTQQVTYNGMPLYHFSMDGAPDDTKGQGGAGGVFLAATP